MALVTSAFALAWLAGAQGWWSLDPTNVEWLMQGDLAQHYLGWAFFRQADWSWPLGSVPLLARPIGASLLMTDSLPILALALRPLSGWLPTDFQYVGPALGAAFIIQGLVGNWLARRWGLSSLEQVLVGVLFVAAPPLVTRLAHDTLCAQWLIVAALGLPAVTPARRPLVATGLAVVAAGTHPYLVAMVLPLVAAALVASAWTRQVSLRAAASGVVAASMGALLVLWSLGAIGARGPTGASGFGFYSANLNTLFNSLDRSRLVPKLAFGDGQYEGFGYLGVGGWLMLIAALALLAGREVRLADTRAWGPLALACLAMAIFAVSTPIMFGSHQVATAAHLYAPFEKLTYAFRSSGRFIWPLHYGLLVGAASVLARWRWTGARALLLMVVVAFQVFELRMPTPLRLPERSPTRTLPGVADYRHLVMYPNQLADLPSCEPAANYERTSWARPALLAYRLHLSFSGGQLARISEAAAAEACHTLAAPVLERRIPSDTLYVVPRSHLTAFAGLAVCGQVDELALCAPGTTGALADYLRAHPVPTAP